MENLGQIPMRRATNEEKEKALKIAQRAVPRAEFEIAGECIRIIKPSMTVPYLSVLGMLYQLPDPRKYVKDHFAGH